MHSLPIDTSVVAHARPPAKLNLFLELLARREDGFHEIDTVMLPIDWCDEIRLQRTEQAGIDLHVHWLPSQQVIANRLGIDLTDKHAARDLDIPENEDNLVHRALLRFIESYAVRGGFQCDLAKRIPAGAGMGGASSDAASALRCAASLLKVPLHSQQLADIAASIGSDVPFFMGLGGDDSITAGRATGRGECLEAVDLRTPLDCVVVYPSVSLSTGKVYANSLVPHAPQNSYRLIKVLSGSNLAELESEMLNRLTEPAIKLAPQIDEILESLWRTGLRTCQLTGSGSACFAIASSSIEATRIASQLRATLEPGAIVKASRSTSVPTPVDMS